MSEKSVEYRSTFPLFGILGLVFVLAKIFEVGPIANWSWLWVLAPFWIGAAIVLSILAVIVIVAFIVAFVCGK